MAVHLPATVGPSPPGASNPPATGDPLGRLAAEDRLLFHCSRVALPEPVIAQTLAMLQHDLDWEYVLQASIRHAVSPLLYHGLSCVLANAPPAVRVPAAILAELQRLSRNSQARNDRLFGVIGDICRAFDRAGIAALGLKEVQLAQEVYPARGLRPMGDIDILIHREDYDRVAACLGDLGFVPLPGPHIPYIRKYAWAHHFRRPSDEVWLDIQWNVMQIQWDQYHEGDFDFEIARMWRGARPMIVDDYQLLVPRPEDMLFHLCLHLEGHAYCELVLFCDIVEMLRHYAGVFDWPYFVAITQRYRVESSVYYVLLLTRQLFQITLPPGLLELLEPAYFKAGSFGPLFGNLTDLHIALDEMSLAAAPPATVMRACEVTVRRQAAAAIHAYKAVDALLAGFLHLGGRLAILGGRVAEKIFPDPALRPFEPLQVLILERDLPALRRALEAGGFGWRADADSHVAVRQQAIRSADPLLAGGPTRLRLRVQIRRDLGGLLVRSGQDGPSKKAVALKSLRAGLRGHHKDPAQLLLPIEISVLDPEELLLYLCAQLGRQTQGRLFTLCRLLEFFRGYDGSLDWPRVAAVAASHGIGPAVSEGLATASAFMPADRIPAHAWALLPPPAAGPRVLEWARYGPQALDRYTGFKRSFYFLFGLLATRGSRARLEYVGQALHSRAGQPAVLPALARELARSIRGPRRGSAAPEDFAYWAAPERMDPAPAGTGGSP